MCRSSSDPYAPSELEGFRPSPDPFRTYPGHNEPSRGSSPPPWYIADPHTPVVSGDFQVREFSWFFPSLFAYLSVNKA